MMHRLRRQINGTLCSIKISTKIMKQVISIFFFIVLNSCITYAQSDTVKARYNGSDYRYQLQTNYPDYAMEHGISGVVEYKFHIDSLGCIDSLIITASPHKVLSKEIRKEILSVKCKWTPHNAWIIDKRDFVLR